MRRSAHNYAAARAQRKAPSLPEGLLWRELRAGRAGVKFRRQLPVGRFVIDCYCAGAKCAFEIDGIAHEIDARPADDAARNAWLAEQGIRVVRIAARDVLDAPVNVAEAMMRMCWGIIDGEA